MLKRYYEKKDKLSNQRKINYEKNKERLLQKQKDSYIQSKEIVSPMLNRKTG